MGQNQYASFPAGELLSLTKKGSGEAQHIANTLAGVLDWLRHCVCTMTSSLQLLVTHLLGDYCSISTPLGELLLNIKVNNLLS